MSKIIGIDARLYGPHAKGLGRYVQELVDGVLRQDQENEYVIFLAPINFKDFILPRAGVRKVLCRSRWYTLAEQVELPYLIARNHIDLMHFPHFNVPILCTVPFLVTIHDLILTKYPSQRASKLSPWLYRLKHRGYKFVISRALARAQKVIAVSLFTKNDIASQFGIPTDKIAMIYEGVAEKLKREEKGDVNSVLRKYGLSLPFIMYVGNAYPHKNLENLLLEFNSLSKERPELKLLLVGGEDYFYKRLKVKVAEEKIKNVIFAGFVPDEDLSLLFHSALAYVFPSLYEGFGLPPLEAMAQGCPVISSERSVMPEILGPAAHYFDPHETAWLKSSLLALEKPGRIEELKRLGFARASLYKWDDCVNATLKLYKSLL
jgi:glycosyltransferase involved in cell wall biosynthesis